MTVTINNKKYLGKSINEYGVQGMQWGKGRGQPLAGTAKLRRDQLLFKGREAQTKAKHSLSIAMSRAHTPASRKMHATLSMKYSRRATKLFAKAGPR